MNEDGGGCGGVEPHGASTKGDAKCDGRGWNEDLVGVRGLDPVARKKGEAKSDNH